MKNERQISRRTVLRGLGAAMALPFLESAAPAASALGKLAGSDVPQRMAYIFVPNGVNLGEWTPKETGFGYELSPILEPLGSVKDDLLVLSGLTHDKGRGNNDGAGDHARSASVFLTGCQAVKTGGAGIRVGQSVDQFAAQQVGRRTRFPSLELAIDRGGNAGNCDDAYSCAYNFNISWSGASTPTAKETDPRQVFDRLFAGGSGHDAEAQQAQRRRRRKSILDFVLADARGLTRRLGVRDQQKLQEYFDSVREVEKRVEAADVHQVAEPEGLVEVSGRLAYEKHVQLLHDLQVLAFQADVTRISTFMYGRAGSNRSFRQIGISEGHHELSHHGGHLEKLRKIAEIDRFHVEQFAYFIEKLKSIPEGEGTLLDNCMILYGSGISDGNKHNNENLPIVLAGSGGGTIDTGRHVKYTRETPLTNLFVEMLDRVGVQADRFGDSTGPLPGLVV